MPIKSACFYCCTWERIRHAFSDTSRCDPPFIIPTWPTQYYHETTDFNGYIMIVVADPEREKYEEVMNIKKK